MKILNPIKTVKDLLMFVHQLPQNLLGMLVIQVTHAWYSVSWEHCYFTDKLDAAVSLGNFIIAPKSCYNMTSVLWHERGHQKQSRKYGWLYLFIVGIPSAVRNVWDRIAHRKWTNEQRDKWYYSGFPEKQADKLGNVNRSRIWEIMYC